MDLRELQADPSKELDGVRVDIDETTWVRVAASGNQRYLDELEKVAARYRNGFRQKKIGKALALKLITDVEAKTILLDWGGIQEKGVDVPYTSENAARILRDYPKFREHVLNLAGDFDWFRFAEDKVEESIEGN